MRKKLSDLSEPLLVLESSFRRLDHASRSPRKIPLALRDRAVDLISNGFNKAEVARICGVSISTLYQWRTRQKVEPSNGPVRVLHVAAEHSITSSPSASLTPSGVTKVTIEGRKVIIELVS